MNYICPDLFSCSSQEQTSQTMANSLTCLLHRRPLQCQHHCCTCVKNTYQLQEKRHSMSGTRQYIHPCYMLHSYPPPVIILPCMVFHWQMTYLVDSIYCQCTEQHRRTTTHHIYGWIQLPSTGSCQEKSSTLSVTVNCPRHPQQVCRV